jgi:Asparagine synthase
VSRDERTGRIAALPPQAGLPGMVDIAAGALRVLGFFAPAPEPGLVARFAGDARGLALELRRRSFDCAGVVVDTATHEIVALRSASAVAPLAVHRSPERLVVAGLDRLAAELSGHVALDPQAGLSFLLSFYPREPATLYAGVKRLPHGQVVALARGQATVLSPMADVSAIDERPGALVDLLRDYRRHAVEAVRRRILGKPGLLLSGGIDSVALGVYLRKDLGYDDLPAFTFRVKGASWDESPIAAEAAAVLGLNHIVCDVDASAEVDLDRFVRETNSPDLSGVYIGHVIRMARQTHPEIGTLFAGQDTRLHTPWLTNQELFALEHPRLIDALVRAAALPAKLMPDRFADATSHNKRLAYLVGVARTLPRLLALRLSKSNFMPILFKRSALESFLPDFAAFTQRILAQRASMRRRFNAMVERCLFHTQIPFDGAAMREPGLANQIAIALPYYDEDIVAFSAALPWAEVVGTMPGVDGFDLNKVKPVNKVFLRKSLAGDLPHRLLARSKAVAPSVDVAVGGALARYVRRMVDDKGGLFDTALGEHLDIRSIRAIVDANRSGWPVEARRIAYVVELMTMLDCIVRAR